MKRVALIVTGQAEHRALHLSLKRLFQDVQFEPMYRESFTANPLPEVPALEPTRPTLVHKLAGALVAAVDPGRTNEPADFAVLIDDLELANAAAPERAIRHLRAAVKDYIERQWPNADRRDRCSQRVKDRCSFHLFAPMLETYFFGEPAALRRAGATREPSLDATRDIEDFETTDAEYLAACPPVAGEGAQARPPPAWAFWPARHPKRYLQFLCDPSGSDPRAYQETKGGCEALRTLDWHAVLARRDHVRFGRSFLLDLADALGRDDLVRLWQGASHPLTSHPGRDRVLRNL